MAVTKRAPAKGDVAGRHTKAMSVNPNRHGKDNMRLFRSKIKAAAVAVSTVAAIASFSATSADEAYAATPAAAPGCAIGVALYHYNYIQGSPARSLDMWGNGYGNPITLGKVSGSSDRDCYKILGSFGDGRFELEQWQTGGCLSIKGPSTAVGAKVILYPCLSQKSQLFTTGPDGIHDIYIKSAYSGRCLDLSNGWRAGSTVVQKTCVNNDPWQGWYTPSLG